MQIELKGLPEHVVNSILERGTQLVYNFDCPQQHGMDDIEDTANEICKEGNNKKQCDRCWNKAIKKILK